MLGAVIIVVIVVVALPVTFFVTGGVLSAVFGWVAKTHAEETHPNSELTELNY